MCIEIFQCVQEFWFDRFFILTIPVNGLFKDLSWRVLVEEAMVGVSGKVRPYRKMSMHLLIIRKQI